jgi:hypothetical protein
VAALVRVRTRDDLGATEGTFTADTRPTAADVTALIANEAPLVTIRTGNLDALACATAADVKDAAAQILAKRVAAIIEASYRPDEVAEGRTVADFYQGDYATDLAALVEAASECRAEGGDVAPGAGPAAQWGYPIAPPLVW